MKVEPILDTSIQYKSIVKYLNHEGKKEMFNVIVRLVSLFTGLAAIKWLLSAALVNSGWEGTVILGAKNDKTRTLRLKFDDTVVTDHATAVTAMTAFLTDLAGVSAGVVKSYTITSRAIEDAYNRPTSDEAEWRDTALVVVDIEDEPLKTANLQIPMPLLAIFRGAAGTLMDEVDPSDTALINYVANWRSTNGLTLSDGEKAGLVIYNGRRLS